MPNKSGARGIHTAAAKEQFRNILQLTISTLRPKMSDKSSLSKYWEVVSICFF